MKSFWLNGYSGRQERWALDGHRWVAAEPRRSGFDLWGYQDDTPEIVYIGSGANEEQLEKLADEFILGDPEIINPAFFLKDDYQLIHAKDDGNSFSTSPPALETSC
jgi:hypothetical protein